MWIYNVEKYDDMKTIKWESMKKGDILQFRDVQNLAQNSMQLKEIFRKMIQQKVQFQLIGSSNIMEPSCILAVLEMYERMKNKELQDRQYIGIKKALEMKKQGKGAYGRPCRQLPEDFEEKIIDCIKHGYALAEYCKEVDMPLSTFYKYANQVILKNKLIRKDRPKENLD